MLEQVVLMGDRSHRPARQLHRLIEQLAELAAIPCAHRDPGRPGQRMRQPAVLQVDGQIKGALPQPRKERRQRRPGT